MPRPILATIRTSALAHNLAQARARAPHAKVWAVVKANAYGHGLVAAARALQDADGYAMLDFEEAIRLRLQGVKKPILLLEGFFKPQDVALLSEYDLTPAVHNIEQIEILERTKLGKPIDAYLKVNSGMNRLGFTVDNVRIAWNALHNHEQVRSVTLMTHFADADGDAGVAAQLDWFNSLTQPMQGPRSLANSAALLRYPDTHADWVRPGIMLYGCSPFPYRAPGDFTAPDQSAEALGLRPAMTLTTEVIALQNLQPGERVGYGFGFEATEEMTIGIIACGYADGYPRVAPTGTPVLVAGQRTRTIGRVSMDMICVDLTTLPEAYIGTPVTLWGDGLSADEVAASAGTLSYELLCGLAARVPVVEVP
jgi:alanine racemase